MISHQIKIILKRIYLHFLYLIRKRNRKSVFFSSFMGQYSDSPRAISEAIHEMDPSIELIWRLKKGVTAPKYIKRVHKTLESKRAQVQADAWVINTISAPGEGNYKGEGTFFVETWHGDRGFKKIGWAAKEDMGSQYSGNVLDCSNVNLFTAASEYGVMQAHEGMRFYGEIQRGGLPRNDKLVKIEENGNYINYIKNSLGLDNKKKILLYAPTFRDKQHHNQKVMVNLDIIVEMLEKHGDKWYCLVRAHNGSTLYLENKNNIIDVSNYGDMTDLLLITDFLVTDYSSCAGDFVLTGRPCVLAQFDRSEYESESRSLWFSPEESGFLIAKNQEELNNIVGHLYEFNHREIADKVLNYYKTEETGESSVKTAKRIIDWINIHHRNQ